MEAADQVETKKTEAMDEQEEVEMARAIATYLDGTEEKPKAVPHAATTASRGDHDTASCSSKCKANTECESESECASRTCTGAAAASTAASASGNSATKGAKGNLKQDPDEKQEQQALVEKEEGKEEQQEKERVKGDQKWKQGRGEEEGGETNEDDLASILQDIEDRDSKVKAAVAYGRAGVATATDSSSSEKLMAHNTNSANHHYSNDEHVQESGVEALQAAFLSDVAALPSEEDQNLRRTPASLPGAFPVAGIGGHSPSPNSLGVLSSSDHVPLAQSPQVRASVTSLSTHTASSGIDSTAHSATEASGLISLVATLSPSEHQSQGSTSTRRLGHLTSNSSRLQSNTTSSSRPSDEENPQEPAYCSSEQPQQQEEQTPKPPLVQATAEEFYTTTTTRRYSPTTIFMLTIVGVLVVAVVILSLGMAGVFSSSSDDDNGNPSRGEIIHGHGLETYSPIPITPANITTTLSLLDQIRNDGVLKCAYLWIPGFISRNDTTGEVDGFNAAWCYAIAAAIMGPENAKVEWVDYDPFYDANDIQLVVLSVTHNMHRQVGQPFTGIPGRSFSIPYFYDGVQLAGDPFFVECAEDKNFKHIDECSDLQICTQANSSHHDVILDKLPVRQVVLTDSPAGVIEGFLAGDCNVLLFESMPEHFMREWGYQGEYKTSNAVYSKEPLSLVTVKDDPRWSDFLRAMVQALIVADQANITQATAHLMPQTNVFGDYYQDCFRRAVAAVGNYAEMWSHHFEGTSIHRRAVNHINNGSTGLLYAHPLGTLNPPDAALVESLGPTMERILQRGILLCGVRLERPGFANGTINDNDTMVVGMEVDLCKAIAASLFGGDMSAVEFIELASPEDGFVQLASGQADVIAGATWNLVNDVQEPTTGLGFAFSQPYFYGYSDQEDNLCLATMQDDHNWISFVYWINTAMVYAEERNITRQTSNLMPEIYVFGSSLKRTLRDALLVGNYGEVYQRNVEPIIPRAGRNLLNREPIYGPQHYIMPGII